MKASKVKGLFGHMIIGRKRFAEEQAYIVEGRTKFGPLVLGDKVKPGTNTPAPDSQPVNANMSLSALAELLGKNPTYLASYVNQEFARPKDAIRRGALRLFIEIAPKAFPKHPPEAAVTIARCQRFLETGSDTAQVATATEGTASIVEGAPVEKQLGPTADALAESSG